MCGHPANSGSGSSLKQLRFRGSQLYQSIFKRLFWWIGFYDLIWTGLGQPCVVLPQPEPTGVSLFDVLPLQFYRIIEWFLYQTATNCSLCPQSCLSCVSILESCRSFAGESKTMLVILQFLGCSVSLQGVGVWGWGCHLLWNTVTFFILSILQKKI